MGLSMLKKSDDSPQVSLNITSHERAVAKQVKKEFKHFLRLLDDSIEIIMDFRDVLSEEKPSKDSLNNKYNSKILKFRFKIRDVFNILLISAKKSIELLLEIADPDIIRIRDVIFAELGELSSAIEAILDILSNRKKDDFVSKIEEICANLEKREVSIKEVIDTQLFSHVNQNILGRMKISGIKERMVKRAKALRDLK